MTISKRYGAWATNLKQKADRYFMKGYVIGISMRKGLQNRHSIRVKLTLTLTVLMVLTIFLLWFLNKTLLERYYLHSKIDTLGNTFDTIYNIYDDKAAKENLTNAELLKLERIRDNRNVSIYVLSGEFDILFPGDRNRGEDDDEKLLAILKSYYFTNPNQLVERIQSGQNYNIYTFFDSRLESNYIDLLGGLDNGYTVLLRTNYESIQESVKIANKFLAYVGIIAVIIGTTIMLFISRKFTLPILQLTSIAKKMSDLDFEVKYEVESKDEIGELGGCINILSEKLESTISELKIANNELLSDLQDKIQIDEVRKEFLSNVTHELKTPIALIQGYAEGLKENINDDLESKEFYCDVIVDEAQKMNQMVKKLLTLNQIEFGNNQIHIGRFDLVALIKSVLSSVEILFKQKGVIMHFDQEESVYVWSDEYLVEEVLTNYISNALNHVSGAMIIEIKLIKQEDVVRVAVFNTGEPIPMEDIDQVWIKFYKVDKARTREYGGSGIGLSIVKAIMTSLNKEYGVKNHDTGVEFWFELDTQNN